MMLCLINPQYALDPSEDSEHGMNGYTIPHLGLGYIASYIRENGYAVELIECMGQQVSNENIYEKISNKHFRIIGISVYDENRINAMRIVRKIRKLSPETFIFLGGYTPTLSSQTVLEHFDVDCCVMGEGEITVLELVQAIDRGQDFRGVKGIAFLSDGAVVCTEPRNLIDDLDMLPFPTRSFYRNRLLTMISGRGCMGNCIYCSIVSFYKKCKGQRYRIRSAENVVKELKALQRQYPDCERIWYYDDNFLESTPANVDRLYELCKRLREEKIRIPFHITACAKDVLSSEHLLAALKRVGLTQVFVGVESLCQRQLDFYNKRITPDMNIQAIEVLQRLGLKVNIGFIPMDPFVEAKEIRQNFEMLKEHGITTDAYTVFSIHIYLVSVPGTPLRALLDRKGMSANNERGYHFAQDDANDIYETLEKWHEIIMPMVVQADLIDAYGKEVSFHMVLKDLFRELIALDIDYIISLCTLVETPEHGGALLAEHLEEWEKAFQRIHRAFTAHLEAGP